MAATTLRHKRGDTFQYDCVLRSKKNGPAIESIPVDGEVVTDTTSENPTRQQPKKTSRSQRKKK